MKSPQSPKRGKTRWILLGCGALIVLGIFCTLIGIIFETISPTTPTPTQIALPSPTQPSTATPSPEPTSTLPVRFITIDGYDPASETIIDPINIWKDYQDRDAGIAAQAHHGDKVKFLMRQGDGVQIETLDGTQGWVSYWFIEEFKGEYLATFTPPVPTSTATSAPTAPPVGQCPGGCMEHLPGCDIKGNISVTTGEKIYHVPGQRDYKKTEIAPEEGERWFCTEEEARAAGWRRAQR